MRPPGRAAPAGRTELGALELAAVVVLCFGLPIWGSLQVVLAGYPANVAGAGAGADGFNDAPLLRTALMEVVTGTLALLVLRWRGYAVGSLYPLPDLPGAFVAVALCAAGWLTFQVFASLAWTPSIAAPIERMVAASHPSVAVLVPTGLLNGAFEEVFLLGVLQRGLARHGAVLAIGVGSLVRLTYHLYQGPFGAASALLWGLVMAVYYERERRLWPPVFAHGLWDIAVFVA